MALPSTFMQEIIMRFIKYRLCILNKILFKEPNENQMPIFVYVCMSVGATLAVVAAAILVFFLCNKKKKSAKTREIKATNRFGNIDKLNNQDNLLIDLLSTKNKGVQDLGLVPTTNCLPIQPGIQLSERSSLRSFFMEESHNQNYDENSEVTSSVQDSGIHSQKMNSSTLLHQHNDDALEKCLDNISTTVNSVIETSV